LVVVVLGGSTSVGGTGPGGQGGFGGGGGGGAGGGETFAGHLAGSFGGQGGKGSGVCGRQLLAGRLPVNSDAVLCGLPTALQAIPEKAKAFRTHFAFYPKGEVPAPTSK
jgi:hypothetical protein